MHPRMALNFPSSYLSLKCCEDFTQAWVHVSLHSNSKDTGGDGCLHDSHHCVLAGLPTQITKLQSAVGSGAVVGLEESFKLSPRQAPAPEGSRHKILCFVHQRHHNGCGGCKSPPFSPAGPLQGNCWNQKPVHSEPGTHTSETKDSHGTTREQ